MALGGGNLVLQTFLHIILSQKQLFPNFFFIIHGFTSILDSISYLDHIIEGPYVTRRRKPFLKLTRDGAIYHSGGEIRMREQMRE